MDGVGVCCDKEDLIPVVAYPCSNSSSSVGVVERSDDDAARTGAAFLCMQMSS